MITEHGIVVLVPLYGKLIYFSLVLQGYDSIPAEIPDPKAKEVSWVDLQIPLDKEINEGFFKKKNLHFLSLN